jgi:hypothetical protein
MGGIKITDGRELEMKTDLEKVKELFDYLGIEYEQVADTVFGHTITIEAGSCPKSKGYNGFITSFDFDLEGKFISMGIWE